MFIDLLMWATLSAIVLALVALEAVCIVLAVREWRANRAARTKQKIIEILNRRHGKFAGGANGR